MMSLCIAASAGAQGSAGEVKNAEADALVSRGIEMRARGKDAEALELFEQAAALDPESVRVQIHLATVHQALGHWLLADDYLSDALRHQNHPYVNRHRQSLDDARRVIDANIGRLEVEGQPAGAEVRLNGRLVGKLPLKEPVRATVGSYVLDVRLDGHYSSQRPIVISGGGLVRETVKLEPLPAESSGVSGGSTQPASMGASSAGSEPLDQPASRQWLTWTFVAASGIAAGTTIGAVIFREIHAGRWNDNSRCLAVGLTRAEVCAGERDKVNAAEDVAIVGGVLTGLFAAGALLNAFAFDAAAPDEVGLAGCGLSWAGGHCFGSF